MIFEEKKILLSAAFRIHKNEAYLLCENKAISCTLLSLSRKDFAAEQKPFNNRKQDWRIDEEREWGVTSNFCTCTPLVRKE